MKCPYCNRKLKLDGEKLVENEPETLCDLCEEFVPVVTIEDKERFYLRMCEKCLTKSLIKIHEQG